MNLALASKSNLNLELKLKLKLRRVEFNNKGKFNNNADGQAPLSTLRTMTTLLPAFTLLALLEGYIK